MVIQYGTILCDLSIDIQDVSFNRNLGTWDKVFNFTGMPPAINKKGLQILQNAMIENKHELDIPGLSWIGVNDSKVDPPTVME